MHAQRKRKCNWFLCQKDLGTKLLVCMIKNEFFVATKIHTPLTFKHILQKIVMEFPNATPSSGVRCTLDIVSWF